MKILGALHRGLKLLYYLIHCVLRILSNILSEFFRKLETFGRRVKTEVFKLFELPSLFSKRVTNKLVIGVLVAVIALSASVIALQGMSGMITRFRSSGEVLTKGVGLYEDSACNVTISELTWGMVEPGSTEYIETYVRNEGNVPVKLYLYADNWSPSNASLYIDFGWDYDNSVLNSDDVLKVNFYLRMSADVHNLVDFTFDVLIDAVEA